jgi:hypothetical protein
VRQEDVYDVSDDDDDDTTPTRLPLSDDANNNNNGGVDEDAATGGSVATPLLTVGARTRRATWAVAEHSLPGVF